MHVILGGTGHVGSATASALLERGEPVTIVTHDPSKADGWTRKGADVAVADVRDADALRGAFRRGRTLFLLSPPAPPSTDTDAQERANVAAIVAALEGSGLERIVAQSTYGARPGDRLGDLSVLFGLERALAAQPIPATIMRAAYLMSNWDAQLDAIGKSGVLTTVFPADLTLPMVAPLDLGRVAARLLTEPSGGGTVHHAEGPERYSPADVGRAFASALGRPVSVTSIPPDQWEGAFKDLDFSDAAATSYARMTRVTLDDPDMPEAPVRGSVSLADYVSGLVEGRGPPTH